MAVCGPVKDEDAMCGPVLPEQPPTQWAAQKSDFLSGPLNGITIEKGCIINDFLAVRRRIKYKTYNMENTLQSLIFGMPCYIQ